MKKVFYLSSILLSAFLSSCGPKEAKEDFRINGVTDLSIPANGTIAMPIEVEQVTGPQQEVSLGMSGLPENVTGNFNTWKGTTKYSAYATFEDKGAKQGVYTVKVWGTNKSGLNREYSLKLTVAQKPCIAESLAGTYSGGYACNQGNNLPTTIIFYIDPEHKDRLQFQWNGKTAYMVLDCNKDEFSIPEQSLTDFSISGSAVLSNSNKTLTLTYKAVYFGSGNTTTCTGSFTKP